MRELYFPAGCFWASCSAIHIATRWRARTCLCRATRFSRFNVCSSSATVSIFGSGRRILTFTGWPSLKRRAKSWSESSSQPNASRFKARRWPAVVDALFDLFRFKGYLVGRKYFRTAGVMRSEMVAPWIILSIIVLSEEWALQNDQRRSPPTFLFCRFPHKLGRVRT
jgi:hypothetical protein